MFKRTLVRTGITVKGNPVAWVGSVWDPRRGLAVMPLAIERQRWVWCASLLYLDIHIYL